MRIRGTWDWISWVLVIIGGLNWGLIGFFNWNLVDAIFGAGSSLSRIIYALVGLGALYLLIRAFGSASER